MSASQRAVNSLIGSFVADAATMGLHWIYDQADVAAKVINNGGSGAFYQPPSCPFYQYASGALSPYGDEIIPFMRSFAEEKGFVMEAAASSSYEFFKSYTGRLNHVIKSFVENRDAGKNWDQCPVVDHQAQGIIKMPLAVARYAGQADLLTKSREMVNVIQDSDISVAASKLLSIIQERILLTSDTPAEAILWASSSAQLASSKMNEVMFNMITLITNDDLLMEYCQFALKVMRVPYAEASERFQRMGLLSRIVENLLKTHELTSALVVVGEADKSLVNELLSRFVTNNELGAEAPDWARPISVQDCTVEAVSSVLGLSCALPGAILTSLYIARKSRTFKDAIETNILVAGDNCSRAIVLGGLFGAAAAEDVAYIPEDWLSQVNSVVMVEVGTLARRIVADNMDLNNL